MTKGRTERRAWPAHLRPVPDLPKQPSVRLPGRVVPMSTLLLPELDPGRELVNLECAGRSLTTTQSNVRDNGDGTVTLTLAFAQAQKLV